ncbi:MAG: cytochrome c biogenesis protein CcsA [Pirellulales bacterium]|nr:cytochrome c biogenesis protein CcsA [Pirellulales bacterium]
MNHWAIRQIGRFLATALLVVIPLAAARAVQSPDDRAWREMPVFDGGRAMPLETLARRVVHQITGSDKPRLAPPSGTETDVLFPDGQPRTFTPSELLLSWLVEPERWQDVAFLKAEDPELREKLLDVPLTGPDGRPLLYVSPRQLDRATGFYKRLEELAWAQHEARQNNEKFEPNETDKAVYALDRAYTAYRVLTYDPVKPAIGRPAFDARVAEVVLTWRDPLEQQLHPWIQAGQGGALGTAVDQTQKTLRELAALWRRPDVTLAEAQPPVAAMVQSSKTLALITGGLRDRVFDEEQTGGMPSSIRGMFNDLAGQARQFARQAAALDGALYDNGPLGPGQRRLRLVPALDPWALEQDRDPGDLTPPWISLQQLLYASPEALEGYPPEQVSEVRGAWDALSEAYTDRDAADRSTRVTDAMQRFADAVRKLGETVGPLREKLPLRQKDESLLERTAYPPPGFARAELLYNRLDAFNRAWLFTAAGLAVLVLAWGKARRFLVGLGLLLLAVGQGFALVGLTLRGTITGMVPVTGMFETVLFVGLAATLLAMGFGLAPLFGPSLVAAWRMTALPSKREEEQQETQPEGKGVLRIPAGASPLRIALLAAEGLLCGALLYVLVLGRFGPGGSPLVVLTPQAAAPTAGAWTGAIALWLVTLGLLSIGLWLASRAGVALLVGLVLSPVGVVRAGPGRLFDEVVARRVLIAAGAAVGLLAYLAACLAPGEVFDREINLKMAAIVRSNFWLAIHVLVIVASYAPGALAWGLGNLSLAAFAFGPYRIVDGARRPPAVCASMAGTILKAMQLAVLLLAAGTITGAIWGDCAWGRPWGWDRKEVWALITLFVYLIVLHVRWVRWIGDLGLAVGAVFGAISILFTWYGVNFLFPGGMHAYGSGAGGQGIVLTCLAANLLLVVFALGRHAAETWSSGHGTRL